MQKPQIWIARSSIPVSSFLRTVAMAAARTVSARTAIAKTAIAKTVSAKTVSARARTGASSPAERTVSVVRHPPQRRRGAPPDLPHAL